MNSGEATGGPSGSESAEIRRPPPPGTTQDMSRLRLLTKLESTFSFQNKPYWAKIVLLTVGYVVTFNVGMRLWKGPDHPCNRFVWMLRERDGTLPQEMIDKKQAFLNYYRYILDDLWNGSLDDFNRNPREPKI